MRRNTTTRSSRRTSTSVTYDEKLILVRDGIFNYLQFFPVTEKKYTDNPTISAKPVVVVKNSDTQSVILDYSGANDTNKKVLDSLFNNLIPGQTLSFGNAHYVDPVKGIDVELTGVLSFNTFKNYIIKTETVGVTLPIPDGNYYDPVYFIDSPTLTVNTLNSIDANSKNKINELKNSVPVSKTNNLLKYLGILPGNYLKIINSDSLNNDTLFRVVDVYTDEHEYITLDPAPQYENLIGEPCLVKVFAPCKQPEAVQNIPFSNDWGCAVIQAGATLTYYGYFSELQANIKAQEFLDSSVQYTPGQECSNAVVGVTAFTTPTNTEATTISNDVTTFDVIVNKSRFYPVLNNLANSIATPSFNPLSLQLTVDVNGIYQFNQNDFSNTGNTLRFSKSQTSTESLYEKYGVTNALNGMKNTITLDTAKYVQSTGLTTVYAYSEQNPNYGFTINITSSNLAFTSNVVFRNAGTI